MDALVALGEDGAHAEELRPFAAQSRDEPEPYSLPAMTKSGTPSGDVLHRRRRRSTSSARRSAGDASTPPSVPGASWLRRRTFANVPRTMTSWLPRREPYEVEVLLLHAVRRGGTCPAGPSALIEPAGEMWSGRCCRRGRASTRAPDDRRERARAAPSCPRSTADASRRSSCRPRRRGRRSGRRVDCHCSSPA